MDGVAATAGVSPQTIYNAVGGKAKLLKAVYDVTLAGDDEPIAMNDRAAIRAIMAAPDARSCLTGYAQLSRVLQERVGPLLAVVTSQAGTGDRDLAEFIETLERERATGNGGVVAHVASRFGLRPGLTVERATDIVWTLTSAEVVGRLVDRRGWSYDDYQTWLAEALVANLLPD